MSAQNYTCVKTFILHFHVKKVDNLQRNAIQNRLMNLKQDYASKFTQ